MATEGSWYTVLLLEYSPAQQGTEALALKQLRKPDDVPVIPFRAEAARLIYVQCWRWQKSTGQLKCYSWCISCMTGQNLHGGSKTLQKCRSLTSTLFCILQKSCRRVSVTCMSLALPESWTVLLSGSVCSSISQLTSDYLHQLFKRSSLKLSLGSAPTTHSADKTCCTFTSSTSVLTGSWGAVGSRLPSSQEQVNGLGPAECSKGQQKPIQTVHDIFIYELHEAESLSATQHPAEQEPHPPGK